MSNMVDKDMIITIIGGGIGGIACAIALQQAGFTNVSIYERDTHFSDRKQGYGLTLTNSLDGPLSKLGVLDECIKKNTLSTSHYIFTEKGDVLGYYGRKFRGEEKNHESHRGNRGNLRISRQDLRQMLLNKLKPNTMKWGSKIVDYTEHDDHVDIKFELQGAGSNEIEIIQSNLLVGADGIRSIVRKLKDKKEQTEHLSPLNYTGVAVILGLSPVTHSLVENRGFYVLDGVHRLFTMPFSQPVVQDEGEREGGGERKSGESSNQVGDVHITVPTRPSLEAAQALTMWQLSFSGLSEEEALLLKQKRHSDIIEEALRRTKGWFDPVQDLIQGTVPDEAWSTPLYDRDAMPLRSKGTVGSRVTCIGDAAHPMSMFKGQGANQALSDGPLLASWLETSDRQNKRKGKRGRADASSSACAHKTTNRAMTHDSENSVNDSNIIPFTAIINNVNNANANNNNAGTLKKATLRAALFTKLRCFEREMVGRSLSKVEGSRTAATHFHSPAVLLDEYKVEGLAKDVSDRLRHSHLINAGLADKLDDSILRFSEKSEKSELMLV